jgi:hypothetical protein
MAAIEGFTEAQNASLANVEVGNIVLVDQIFEHTDSGNDSGSDDNDESDDGSDEESDDDEQPDSDSDDSSSESESESGAVTPRAIGEQNNHGMIVKSAPPGFTGYQTLRSVDDGGHDDTGRHPITVYFVVKAVKNAKRAIEDLSLVPLKYSAQAGASTGTFQLYGNQCVPSFYTGGTAVQSSLFEGEFINIRDLPGSETLKFTVSPQGDHVRNVVLDDECPACDEGWLDGITQLAGMVKDYTIPSSQINEPTVCPSCIGIDLMKEHQDLRAELEAFSRISDFGAIVAFHGRLATRRRDLEYDFYQFDER